MTDYTLADLLPKPNPPQRPGWLVPVLIAAGVFVLSAAGVTTWALTRARPAAPAAAVTTPAPPPTTKPAPPPLLSISGSFDLIDDDEHWKVGQDCEGSGGYSDIHIGTEVIVSSDGSVLGKGVLLGGTARRTGSHVTCGYEFLIFGVPAGRNFYAIQVSHRGELHYTERELTEGLALSLGG